MNESVLPVSLPSVLRKDSKPVWNVTETTAFPMELTFNSKYEVFIYMTPYEPAELRDILKKAVSGYKRQKNEVSIVREDPKIYAPLFDAHFVKMGNSTGTPDAQRQFFDKHTELKPSIVAFSFGGIKMEDPVLDSESTVFDIGMSIASEVTVSQSIYDDVNHEVVKIDMAHQYSQPTESQYREYRMSRENKLKTKSGLWTISENYPVLEKLYDAVVESVLGLAVNSKPCVQETKSEWVGCIPLWHKLPVVDKIFGDLVEKND